MKKIILGLVLVVMLISMVATQVRAQAEAKNKTKISASPDWASLKQELVSMGAKFKNAKLSKNEKVKMLPHSNEVLSDIAEMKLNGAAKAEQIQAVVQFIATSIDADFANSNTNTIYFDYKENKAAYLKEINKLKGPVKTEILEAFKDWEDFERDSKKPESESSDL